MFQFGKATWVIFEEPPTEYDENRHLLTVLFVHCLKCRRGLVADGLLPSRARFLVQPQGKKIMKNYKPKLVMKISHTIIHVIIMQQSFSKALDAAFIIICIVFNNCTNVRI